MLKYLLFGALPFNALVAIVVCLITYFVYKKISIIFKHDFLNHTANVRFSCDICIEILENVCSYCQMYAQLVNPLQILHN